jgi:hypothetical protein
MGLTTHIVDEHGREVTDVEERLAAVEAAWREAAAAIDAAWKITPSPLFARTPVPRGVSDHALAHDKAQAMATRAARALGAVRLGREQRERGASYAPESDEAAVAAAMHR